MVDTYFDRSRDRGENAAVGLQSQPLGNQKKIMFYNFVDVHIVNKSV